MAALSLSLPEESEDFDITSVVGLNLRRFRTRQGLSLERLARASGVSRAMLGQVELGRSAPTISILWKIARALDVPFQVLTAVPGDDGIEVQPGPQARWLPVRGGSLLIRQLLPADWSRQVGFYQIRLAAQESENAHAHPAGTRESLVVHEGCLELVAGRRRQRLEAGDAVSFRADVPHRYHNPGDRSLLACLTISFCDPDQSAREHFLQATMPVNGVPSPAYSTLGRTFPE